jgi:CheY-like chemotaxis protein
MNSDRRPFVLLCAEDDEDYRLLARRALHQSNAGGDVRFVEDGEELLDYLRRTGRYTDPAVSPRPGVILLDLNMPRKDGREALREIKQDPALRTIPVVVLTTSNAVEDILGSYELGANSYIRKPLDMQGLIDVMTTIGHYWFDIVQLPPGATTS